MARVKRLLPDTGYLYVSMQADKEKYLVKDDEDYRSLYKIIRHYSAELRLKIYHYCITPAMIDLLVYKDNNTNVCRFVRSVGLTYKSYYRRKYLDKDKIWGDRYKSLIIGDELHLLMAGHVIENKPLSMNLVSNLHSFRFSSYRAYAYGIYDILVNENPYYNLLAETALKRQEIYISLFVDPSKVNENLLMSLRYLGEDSFIKEMEEKFKVKNTAFTKKRTGVRVFNGF